MNKLDAVAYLETRGIKLSVGTLDRHRKEGRVVATEVPTKTGPAKDYSQEALDAYVEAERTLTPSLVVPSAKPSQEASTQALAKPTYEAIQGGIQKIVVVDEPLQALAKPLPSLSELMLIRSWTIDEASAVTGLSKGSIRDAIKKGELKGGLNGGKLKVNAKDALRWADEYFG